MKLHSPQLEREIRSAVLRRQRVRAPLNRLKLYHRRLFMTHLWGQVVLLMALVPLHFMLGEHYLAFAWSFWAIVALAYSFNLAEDITQRLMVSLDSLQLLTLPASAEVVAGWTLRKWLYGMPAQAAVHAIFFSSLIPEDDWSIPTLLLALLFGGVATLVQIAMTWGYLMLLPRREPPALMGWLYAIVLTVLLLTLFGGWVGIDQLVGWITIAVKWLTPALNVIAICLPTGWVGAAYALSVDGEPPVPAVLLLMAAAFAFCGIAWAFRNRLLISLANSFSDEWLREATEVDLSQDDEFEDLDEELEEDGALVIQGWEEGTNKPIIGWDPTVVSSPDRSPAEARELIASGAFLKEQLVEPPSHWYDQLCYSWLKDGEIRALEIFYDEWPELKKGWVLGWAAVGALLLLMFAYRFLPLPYETKVVTGSIFLALLPILSGIPLRGDLGRGFTPVTNSVIQVWYPVRWKDLAGLSWKFTYFQMILVAPPFMAWSALASSYLGGGILVPMLGVALGLAIFASMQPLYLTLRYCLQFRFFTSLVYIGIIFFIPCPFGLIIFGFINSPWLLLLLPFLLYGISRGIHAMARNTYNLARMDLIQTD